MAEYGGMVEALIEVFERSVCEIALERVAMQMGVEVVGMGWDQMSIQKPLR